MTAEPAVALHGAARAYEGRAALRGVDLALGAGERVALIGPSGAGKTTLLRLVSGFVWPTAGAVRVLGEDPSALRGQELRALRRRVGLLHQDDNLIPGLRVAHNVLAGRLGEWGGWRALLSLLWPRELDVARDALAEVELADRLWALPEELSGGERQRVALARLLVQAPRVLLADEPAASLDRRLGADVLDRLGRFATEDGACLLVSLHGLELVRGRFDRVVALRDGEVFWQGAPGDLTRELLEELYGAESERLHLEELAFA